MWSFDPLDKKAKGFRHLSLVKATSSTPAKFQDKNENKLGTMPYAGLYAKLDLVWNNSVNSEPSF